MAADPIASLRVWPVTLNLGDAGLFRIEARTAADWLEALFETLGSLDPILDLMEPEDRDRLDEAIFQGETTSGEVMDCLMDALTQVSGRPWWQTFLMLGMLRAEWSRFHGRVLRGGLDPQRVSLAAYLDAVYSAFVEGLDQQGRQGVHNQITTPPPGLPIEIDESEEEATFLSMMNSSDRRPR